jgi:uncharacterized protein with PQ loop repeat
MNLSLVATVLSMFATLPQLYRTVSTGVLRDFHPTTLGIGVLANLLLAAHGLRKNDMGIVVFGVWFAVYNGVLFAYLKRMNTSSTIAMQ